MSKKGGFTINWDQKTVQAITRKLTELEKRMKKAGAQSAQAAGEHVMAASQALVPHKSGELMSTGRVDKLKTSDAGVTVPLSYGTTYAEIQHERTDFEHPGGRIDHYLEQPLMSEGEDVLKKELAARVLAVMRSLAAQGRK